LRGVGIGEVHLDGESAHLGFEDGMHDVLLARKDLLYSADLAADDHVEIAVVDGSADGGAGLIVVGHEGEVEARVAVGIEVVRALLGGGDGVVEALNLAIVFLQLLFGDGQGDVELGDVGAEFGLLIEDVERIAADGGLVDDAVGEEDFGDLAVGVGVAGLVDGGDLGGGVALGDEAGGEVLVDVGLELLELREDGLGLLIVGLLLPI
jgi:hypothetical protein